MSSLTADFEPSTRSDAKANTSRYLSKTVEFDGSADAGQVGVVSVFTVTGAVFVEKLVPQCTEDLTVSSGVGTASIQLGVTGATSAFVATTTPGNIDADEFWVDNAPDPGIVAIPAALKDLVVCKDIVAEVTNTESVDAEVSTLTFPAKAAATSGDYIVISSQSGLTFAVALDKTLAAEVAVLTYDTKANTTSGDYAVVTAQDGTTYAVSLDKALTAEVATLTFPTKAGATAGDYVVITAQDGTTYAASLDVTGADPEPTGASWTAVDPSRRVHVDISGATTEADVAALVETDIDGITGFTAKIVTDDSAADGTMTFTQQTGGAVADPVPHNADDSGVGSITVAITTAGADAVTPTGAAWVAATHKVIADITGDTTAAQVAARAETAWNSLTGFTADVTTDDTAADGTMTFTQQVRGAVANPVPHNADDSGVGSITVAITTAGADAVTPSGAAYTAVVASRKAIVDITADTTAAQVAARAETSLNALTGFTALITTDDTAADGTMTLTQTAAGDTTNPVPHNADDSGAGSITTAETNSGTSLASLTNVNGGAIRFDLLWRPISPDGNVA